MMNEAISGDTAENLFTSISLFNVYMKRQKATLGSVLSLLTATGRKKFSVQYPYIFVVST